MKKTRTPTIPNCVKCRAPAPTHDRDLLEREGWELRAVKGRGRQNWDVECPTCATKRKASPAGPGLSSPPIHFRTVENGSVKYVKLTSA